MMKPSSAAITYVAMTLGVGAVALLAAGLVGSAAAAVVALLGGVYLLYSLFALVGEVVDYRIAEHHRTRPEEGVQPRADGDGSTGRPGHRERVSRHGDVNDDDRKYVGEGVYVKDIPRRALESIRSVFS